MFPLGANFDEDLMRAKLAWELRPLRPSRKNGKISYAPSLIGGAEDEGPFQMWSPQQSQFYTANATDAMSSQFGDVDSHLACCNRMHDDSSLNSSLNSIFDCDAQLEKLQKECADQCVEQVHNKGKGCDDVWSPPRQDEVPIYDVRRLAKEPPCSTIHTGMFSVQDKHYLHLMRHLDAVRAPKHMFKTVLEWAKDASSDGFDFMQNHPDRNQFVEQLQKRFRLPPPTIVTIGLEYAQGSSQCHRSVDVVVWDVAWQIQRLMNDYYLMHPDNLVLNDPKNPYEPHIPSKRGDEYQDGRLFQDAQKRLRIGPIDLVIGTELYGDRTHVDVRGRFTLEPWVGALSITNRKTRERWDAQFVLGYVTDVKLSSAESKLLTGTRKGELQGIKVCNYHRQLNTIFRSYRQIQWGTEMWVAVGLKEELRNLILPVLSVKGDGASNNVVCGLMKGTNPDTIDRLVYSCNCPAKMTHVPDQTCMFLRQNDMEPFIWDALRISGCDGKSQQEAIAVLKGYSAHAAYLAFFDLLMADDNKEGIYGLSPIDLMHAFDEGIVPYILEIFLEHVGGDKARALLDTLLRRLIKTKRQSGWGFDFPKTDFTNGVTNLSCLKACEQVGIVFLFAIVCRSGVGQRHFTDDLQKRRADLHEAARNSDLDHDKKEQAMEERAAKEGRQVLDKDRPRRVNQFTEYDNLKNLSIDNWGELFETLLCFRAWTKREDGFWDCNNPEEAKEKEEIASDSITEMLKMTNGYAPRAKVETETHTVLLDSQQKEGKRGRAWQR